MDSDYDLEGVPDFDSASEEEKESIRKALREFDLEFTTEAIDYMKAHNLTKEEVLSMLVKATRSDN